MRCFVHLNTESVGVCKNCQKGLCPECFVDCDNGLACKGCEKHVRALNQFLDNSVHRKINTPFVTTLMAGLFFIGFGASLWQSNTGFLPYGFIFLGSAFLFNTYRSRPFRKK